MSEDCLYLNIWVPAESRTGGWPVIVWSGGGGFATGGGAFAEEDPARLAARGAVVVTFNYRLGMFGFLAHPALTEESPEESSGNYGLLDQMAALRWVRENITRFSGDSSRITLMAESSGAAAGLLMLTTPHADDLFDRAVLLSPGSVAPLLSLAEAEQAGAPLGSSVEEIRALPAADVLARTSQFTAPPSNLTAARPMRPIVDDWLITSDRAYADDEFAPVPVIIGSNEDEGRFFVRRLGVSSLGDYASYLSSTFGPLAADAAIRYPAAIDADVPSAVAAVYGDVSINHAVDRLAHAFARRQSRTFRFVYGYRHGATDQPPTHADEAGTFLDSREHVTQRDADIADGIGRYIVAFAESGEPRVAGLPEWPPFEPGADDYLRLDVPLSVGSRWRASHLEFVARALSASSAR